MRRPDNVGGLEGLPAADEAVKPGDVEGEGVAIIPSNEPAIRDLIYTVRGTQVILDSDLARLYQVETSALNRAAKRNEDRFPEDFRFRITRGELDDLRCQIGILAGRKADSAVGRTYLPYVYTEQGVAMLSAVLRSQVAIDASVRVMRAFVEMRHFIADNAAMFEQIRAVELRQMEYQRTTDERFERVFDYMDTHDAPRQKIFFDGQVYDAFELLVSIMQRAEHEIVLIDGYVDTFNAQYPGWRSDAPRPSTTGSSSSTTPRATSSARHSRTREGRASPARA